MKGFINKTVFLAILFVMASGITYMAMRRWTAQPRETGKSDTLTGVRGLNEGEVVVLPELRTLDGKPVSLAKPGKGLLLCGFFSASCSGCALDAELWKALNVESAKRGMAFYLVDIGDDPKAIERFLTSYKLEGLPVLFDPAKRIGPTFRVGLVPQYLLFSLDGKVIHRWDGIRHYDKENGADKLTEFFRYSQ